MAGSSLKVNGGDDEKAVCESGSFQKRKIGRIGGKGLEVPYFTREDPYGYTRLGDTEINQISIDEKVVAGAICLEDMMLVSIEGELSAPRGSLSRDHYWVNYINY